MACEEGLAFLEKETMPLLEQHVDVFVANLANGQWRPSGIFLSENMAARETSLVTRVPSIQCSTRCHSAVCDFFNITELPVTSLETPMNWSLKAD